MDDEKDNVPESLRKSLENSKRISENLAPVFAESEKLYEVINNSKLQSINISLPPQQMTNVLPESVLSDSAINKLGKIAIKSVLPDYQFDIPGLKTFKPWNNSMVKSFASGLTTLINSAVMKEFQEISSSVGKWLQTIDFSPLINILDNIKDIGFDIDYEKTNEIFLKAMFDARWFPYAGWIADFRIVDAMLDILNTSRASKNRIKRIDSLIFSYYNKEEIDNFKRRWRRMELPSYMTRILVQCVQAYHRREYALTVCTLTTMWEGIIQEKAKDNSFRISKRTKTNLSKLVEQNDFDSIFTSFSEEFIFYNCLSPDDVKEDVPGRHSIAHAWYDTYPNRKMALNAILFTDFLLELKPLEETIVE